MFVPPRAFVAAAFALLLAAPPVVRVAAQPPAPHNVILFVPDGLRASIVDATTAPELNAIKTHGVWFANSHSIFPTFTTANASGMATGHYLGDTGDFSNTIYAGFRVAAAGRSQAPFLESDTVLQEMSKHYGGNYLNEETILAAARAKGYDTASVGKLGPVAIFDASDLSGQGTIVIDDSTGHADAAGNSLAWPLAPAIDAALKAQLGTDVVPPRIPPGSKDPKYNGWAGTATVPGTTSANLEQQNYFVDAATKVVLPALKAKGAPFVMVFWSRDPDGTQHNQGDSLNAVTPGINGPTSLAAIKNADDDLKRLRDAVRALGLEKTTDLIVAADHGFSTISKQSATSPAAHFSYPDVPANFVPPGFLAIDIAQALGLPLSDPDDNDRSVHPDLEQRHSSRGSGLIGYDTSHPDVVIAANGGSDLVYFPQPNAAQLVPKVLDLLMHQDYVSGLFVDDRLGTFPGTLPLSSINFVGAALPPMPAVVVNFRSYDTGCSLPERCAVEVADYALQQGQGMHGSFSRADTQNFMAAYGPDFKRGYADPAPVSNADIGWTIAKILGLPLVPKGKLIGRAMSEAMTGGTLPAFSRDERRSAPGPDGLQTVIRTERVGTTTYFDAGGFPGRTVGL
jgi:predicted AlkP superfamily pyrophosphatase or phosphodiesterase